jgi:hypothetical protein
MGSRLADAGFERPRHRGYRFAHFGARCRLAVSARTPAAQSQVESPIVARLEALRASGAQPVLKGHLKDRLF